MAGKYYLGDCVDCPHMKHVEEQDGIYAVCDRQGTLAEPFGCKILDMEKLLLC